MELVLNQLPEDLREQVGHVVSERERLFRENQILREIIRLHRIEKYGPRSEKLIDGQLELLELEPGVSSEEIQAEAEAEKVEQPLTPKTKNADHPGRDKLPAHLPRKIETVPVPEERCACPRCHELMPIIGHDESEQLDVEPAKYFVRVIRREKRACRKCAVGVEAGPLAPRILPKSKLSDAFLIEVLVQKYARHTPIYRQAVALEQDMGFELSPQTIGNGVMAAGRLLEPVVLAMKPDLLAAGYIQADETTMPVQNRVRPGKNHTAFLWEYSRPGGPVLFDFRMGREREGPKAFLKGFRGWLQTDGYGAYKELGSGIEYVGCLAHARRKFFQAQLVESQAAAPKEILKIFGELYDVEAEARKLKLDPQARLALRQERSVVLMEDLSKKVIEIKARVLPQSKLGQACAYTINQWKRLMRFLEAGVLEIDNNWCENAMRPVALGRKNWLHLGNESSGPKVAAILSIFETCKRLDIPVREYLLEVLPRLGDWPMKRVAELTPTAWFAAYKARIHPVTLPA